MRDGWIAVALAAVLLAGPVAAQPASRPAGPPPDQIAAPGKPGWTVDARTGCWVWNPNPQPDETVGWSGGCPQGPAEGEGRGEWRVGEGEAAQIEGFLGTLRNGRLEGRGSIASYDGSGYDGEWRDGKRHGRGIATQSNGVRYDGEWRDGQRHGRGVQSWPDGARYEGQWRDNRPDGEGTLTMRGGSVSGTWFGGCFADEAGRRIAIERRLEDCAAGLGRPIGAPGAVVPSRGEVGL